MTGVVVELWGKEQLPGWDGLYRAGGLSRVARFDPEVPGGLELGPEFDLVAQLEADPDWLSTILGTTKKEIPDGSGHLAYGECANGSEGYFARLDTDENLVWVVHFENSNPFIEASVSDSTATFTTNLGLSVVIDLSSLDFGFTLP
jgi:hypothetical protein